MKEFQKVRSINILGAKAPSPIAPPSLCFQRLCSRNSYNIKWTNTVLFVLSFNPSYGLFFQFLFNAQCFSFIEDLHFVDKNGVAVISLIAPIYIVIFVL